MDSDIICRQVNVQEILNLRAEELRTGKPVESARFPEDDLASALHFGGFFEGRIICCLTLLKQGAHSEPVWQLRGMATSRSWQRKGAGRVLLNHAEKYLTDRYPNVKIWCNARIHAVPFYSMMGYRIISDPFQIKDIGLHQKMEKIIL